MGRGGGRREAKWWWLTTGLVICSAKDWEWWHCGGRHKVGCHCPFWNWGVFLFLHPEVLRALDESWALRNCRVWILATELLVPRGS